MRRMNCSRICLRFLIGRLSLGITNLSLRGTPSPISCISPSTAHHSDFPIGGAGENVDLDFPRPPSRRGTLRGDPDSPPRNHLDWVRKAVAGWERSRDRERERSIIAALSGSVGSKPHEPNLIDIFSLLRIRGDLQFGSDGHVL